MVFALHIRQCRWCMGSLRTFFKCVLDQHVPLKKKCIRGDQLPWISPDLLREISHRNKLFKRHKRHPTSFSRDDYKRQRNRVTLLKFNALKTFCCYASLSAKHLGEFWRKWSPFCQLVLVKTFKAWSSLRAVVLFATLGVWQKSLVINLRILFS